MELNKVLNTLEVKDIKEDLQMPQIFKFGGYIIFFWSNENKPTESVHVHIAKHNPRANSTKIWITKRGKAFSLKQQFINICQRFKKAVSIY